MLKVGQRMCLILDLSLGLDSSAVVGSGDVGPGEP